MEVLNESHVTQHIIVDQFDVVVAIIIVGSYHGFSNEELSANGRSHNKALHISMKCHDNIPARVLVDIDYSLNVMPKSTLATLSVDKTYTKPSAMVVKAFDGLRRQVTIEINLPI